ncbi:nuclear transport factor 2 family protein [Nocardia carnea]|uniref:nuclear transport factor 2 family protein n=1 Tax=Nocardia carnea TaxID=37328 RepID=UPI0024590CE4|nr:nuclear transport factor 2 family protein [Nocardia carnea]
MSENFDRYDSDRLPKVVVTYLDAHDDHRTADAAALFTPGATVLDDGKTYEGSAEITEWLRNSATEYSYTSTRIGQHSADDRYPVVLIRLDGNFPGGTATVHYRFELDGDRIRRLAIEA